MVIKIAFHLLVQRMASLNNLLQTQILGFSVAYHQTNDNGRVSNYSSLGYAKFLKLDQTLKEGKSFSPVV